MRQTQKYKKIKVLSFSNLLFFIAYAADPRVLCSLIATPAAAAHAVGITIRERYPSDDIRLLTTQPNFGQSLRSKSYFI
jgi:hypothetical protein